MTLHFCQSVRIMIQLSNMGTILTPNKSNNNNGITLYIMIQDPSMRMTFRRNARMTDGQNYNIAHKKCLAK